MLLHKQLHSALSIIFAPDTHAFVFRKKTLTFQSCVICTAISLGIALLRNDFQEERVVDTLENQSSWCHGNFKKKPKKDKPQTPPKTCPRCERSPEHSRQQCPAKEEQCYKCGKRGHFQIMCCCKLCHNVSVVESADQEAFIGVVQDSEHENPWITLAVNGKPLKFKIDTGADVSVIPHKLFKNIPGASLTPAKKILSGPGYKVLPVKGQFVATLQHGNKQVTEDVFVVRRLSRALLERPAIESLDLVSRVNAVQSKKKLLCEFPKLFDGLGKLDGEY